ncbi:MAG: glycosyltransferase family 39 protein [Bacteroidia bacterium]|nr:glycosyltransferase family 39 protein [Bacteroidia bacterium]
MAEELIDALKKKVNPKWNLLFAVLFYFVALNTYHNYLGLYDHIEKRPCSVHIWAQTARASIALNYSRTDMNFFKPHIHKYLEGDGVTGLEFPLVNYVPAILYKLFGFNEMYYRGFVLFTIVMGLFFFYLLLNSYIKNSLVSFGLILSAYCSPVMAFYSINFMPDVTSLAFVLIAWFFFFRFLKNEQTKRDFIIFLVFATLAALIKITSLITLIAVMCLVILDHTSYFKKQKNGALFENKKKLLLYLVYGILVVLAWYAYSFWLTKYSKTQSFTMQTALITDIPTAMEVLGRIMDDHIYEYYPHENYVLYACLIGFMILGFKFVDRVLFTTFVIVTIGNICFFYFLFYQFKDHDYYVIPILTSVFFLMLIFADLLSKIKFGYFKWIYTVFLVILFFNLKESIVWTKRDLAKRFDTAYIKYFDKSRSYDDLEPKLRKLGVLRTDRTLSGFEDGWCNSLYKMDQIGYTFTDTTRASRIDSLLTLHEFKYLVVSDSAKFNKVRPRDLKTEILTTHRGLIVYKINNKLNE